MRQEQLNYLKEIARVGSISAASTYLNITPQALSSSIKTLEKELGFTVFVRTNQGVALTEAGLKLLACANQFFDEVEGIRLSKDKVKKSVCIHITQEASDYFALPLIKEISDADNELSLTVRIEPVELLRNKMYSGEIDSFFSIAPEYEGTFFADHPLQEIKRDALEYIVLGPIATLHCLVPKSVATMIISACPSKQLQPIPAFFGKQPLKTAALSPISSTTFRRSLIIK